MKSTSYVFNQRKRCWFNVGFGRYFTGCLALLSLLVAEQTVAEQTKAIEKEQLMAPGLRDRVEIIKDQWGVSHIYAENQRDLFFRSRL